jgi:hypothetical protein
MARRTDTLVLRAVIDATDLPELRRIAEEVRDTGESMVIRSGDEELAVVSPIDSAKRSRGRKPTSEQIEAAMAAFGGWESLIDGEELKANIREGRSSRPRSVDL